MNRALKKADDLSLLVACWYQLDSSRWRIAQDPVYARRRATPRCSTRCCREGFVQLIELREPTLRSRAAQVRVREKRQPFRAPPRLRALNSLSRKSKR